MHNMSEANTSRSVQRKSMKTRDLHTAARSIIHQIQPASKSLKINEDPGILESNVRTKTCDFSKVKQDTKSSPNDPDICFALQEKGSFTKKAKYVGIPLMHSEVGTTRRVAYKMSDAYFQLSTPIETHTSSSTTASRETEVEAGEVRSRSLHSALETKALLDSKAILASATPPAKVRKGKGSIPRALQSSENSSAVKLNFSDEQLQTRKGNSPESSNIKPASKYCENKLDLESVAEVLRTPKKKILQVHVGESPICTEYT